MPPKKKREIEINPALKYQKLLRRAAKAVRGFLVQKLTRKIKQFREEHDVPEDAAELPEQLQQMINELQRVKHCSHETAADHALPELGFPAVVTEEPDDIMQQIVRHKKMREAVDECKQMLEAATKAKKKKQKKDEEGAAGAKRKRQADGTGNTNKRRIGNYVPAQDGTRALFVDSLSGLVDDEDDLRWLGRAGKDVYDEDGNLIPEKKKNRPGQRARRARFEQQQALDMNIYKPASERTYSNPDEGPRQPFRKGAGRPEVGGAGRRGEERAARDGGSFKQSPRDRPPRDEAKARPAVAPEVLEERRLKRLEKTAVQGGKEWKEKGLHPSWAAKQMNKQKQAETIVAFQGKKITFGDDDS